MIGTRLTELREEMNWQQKDLAEKLQISASSVSSYERNNSEPDDEIKLRIAKLFNISLDYLIGATDLRIPLMRHDAIDLPDGYPDELIPDIQRYIKVLYESYKYNGM